MVVYMIVYILVFDNTVTIDKFKKLLHLQK